MNLTKLTSSQYEFTDNHLLDVPLEAVNWRSTIGSSTCHRSMPQSHHPTLHLMTLAATGKIQNIQSEEVCPSSNKHGGYIDHYIKI